MRIRAANINELNEGATHCVKLDKLKVLMAKIDGKVYAIENKCSHLGLSMEKGELNNEVVTCPFHGSKFNVTTGENVDWVNSLAGHSIPEWSRKVIGLGKKPEPVRSFPTEIEGDLVYIIAE